MRYPRDMEVDRSMEASSHFRVQGLGPTCEQGRGFKAYISTGFLCRSEVYLVSSRDFCIIACPLKFFNDQLLNR
jgi:hypothetical protein